MSAFNWSEQNLRNSLPFKTLNNFVEVGKLPSCIYVDAVGVETCQSDEISNNCNVSGDAQESQPS